MPHAAAIERLAAQFRDIPPVAPMRIRIASYDGDTLCLSAPLASHVNDKGSAFGGSLVSMMTLASWGQVMLQIEQAGLAADVFVAHSEVRYREPLLADLEVESRLSDDCSWDTFLSTLAARGRAHATLLASVALPDGGIACDCRSRYVAIAKRQP
ncbi:MAG: YiiD C-terminal domain-containing protein [Luteimonas sp.]